MVNEIFIPKTEEVREIKYEIPTYEEFMKTYENDGNLNYDDLSGCGIEIQKGYGPCSYSPYEVNTYKVAGRHINMCGSLNCSYYRRITGNRLGGAIGSGISTGAGIGFAAALFASPFTGGLSLLAVAGLSTAASTSLVAGNVLTLQGVTESLEGVENELRLKWESEKAKEKINILQKELNEIRSQYKCGQLTNYRLREIIREKEAKLRQLEVENRRISAESAERWQAIQRLEETIRELKSML